MKTRLHLPLLFFIIIGCGSKSSVTRIGVAKDESMNSFYYALPQSNLLVTVEVEKKIVKPGVYKTVAELFGFNIKEICSTETTSYKITKTDISTKTYFDDDQIFKYNFSKNFLNKNDFKIEFAANGEIINSEVKNESQVLPVASSVLGFIGSVYGSITTLSTPILPKVDSGLKNDDLILYKHAAADFKSLNDLKDSYYKALQNDNGTTKEIVELKLKKFEDAMNDIISKFTGTINKKTFQLVFEIEPKEFVSFTNDISLINTSSQTKDLFYFDSTKGISRILNQTWFAPIEEIENSGVSQTVKYSIKLFKIDNESLVKINPDVNKTKTSGGLYYRMPVNAKFIINTTQNNVVKTEKSFDITIPQYGLTLAAPDNMKSLNFKLHPTLGSILSVEGTTKSVDTEAIDKLGTSSSGLIDKFKEVEEPNKKDALIKELERDIKIKELQEQLNGAE